MLKLNLRRFTKLFKHRCSVLVSSDSKPAFNLPDSHISLLSQLLKILKLYHLSKTFNKSKTNYVCSNKIKQVHG